ncbi:MAG: OmpA family protein [Polyangiaceae bacterium]|nr:OmpA family protein [Polyangiaceae bacterium]
MLGTLTLGCGHWHEKYDQEVARYGMLANQFTQEKTDHAATRAELETTQKKVLRLSDELKKMGVDMDSLAKQLEVEGTEKQKLASSLEQMRRALDEYKVRAAQLERIKKRFEELSSKLKKLTELGLKVEIRNNRMVIRLPGDVLFASGSDKLQDEGKKVITAVAEVIRKDPDLAKRYYQIAGHTDDRPLKGGQFKDNWGLSVMRARSVLVFLVAPLDDKEGGGGLDARKLHAAGYGETDPAVTNKDDETRKQNRRVELVVMPDVEEMLDLKSLSAVP